MGDVCKPHEIGVTFYFLYELLIFFSNRYFPNTTKRKGKSEANENVHTSFTA